MVVDDHLDMPQRAPGVDRDSQLFVHLAGRRGLGVLASPAGAARQLPSPGAVGVANEQHLVAMREDALDPARVGAEDPPVDPQTGIGQPVAQPLRGYGHDHRPSVRGKQAELTTIAASRATVARLVHAMKTYGAPTTDREPNGLGVSPTRRPL